MITTAAQASGRTKRSQAMRLSDPAKSTAPAAATTFPRRDRGGDHRRDHDHVHRDGRPQRRFVVERARGCGARSARPRPRRPPTRRRARRRPVGRSRSRSRSTRARRGTRPSPGTNSVARQHQEHVAREREHERGDEPRAPVAGAGGGVERDARRRSARRASRACTRTRARRSSRALLHQSPSANTIVTASATPAAAFTAPAVRGSSAPSSRR